METKSISTLYNSSMYRTTGELAFFQAVGSWLYYRELMVRRAAPSGIPGAKYDSMLNQIGQLDNEKEMRLILEEMRLENVPAVY